MEEEFYLNKNKSINSNDNDNQQGNEFNALQELLRIFSPFDKQVVKKLIKTVITFYELNDLAIETSKEYNRQDKFPDTKFSDNRDIAPKEFMMEKNPQTDVDKVACLAYYLTHYRNQEEFKAVDISKLNTEAAQLKLANVTVALDHATRSYGFLVPTKKGFKKLSAIGELYVQALPDKDEAKSVIAKNRPKRKKKKINSAKLSLKE